MDISQLIIPEVVKHSGHHLESFGSYLYRLAKANYCPVDRPLSIVAMEHVLSGDIYMAQLIFADKLLQIGAAPELIRMASCGWGQVVRWCPDCLCDGKHRHLLMWQQNRKCLIHGVSLIDRCASCGFQTRDSSKWSAHAYCLNCRAEFCGAS